MRKITATMVTESLLPLRLRRGSASLLALQTARPATRPLLLLLLLISPRRLNRRYLFCFFGAILRGLGNNQKSDRIIIRSRIMLH